MKGLYGYRIGDVLQALMLVLSTNFIYFSSERLINT